MREIKFRAWLWNEKEMSEVLVLDNQEEKVFVVRKDGAAGWRMFAEVELVQYTGLKDKYGVEIYEGDIVQAFSQGVKGNFEVKWRQEGSPSWVLFPAWQSSQMWHLHAIETEKGQYQDSVTVIGNRYENPELLKEEPTC